VGGAQGAGLPEERLERAHAIMSQPEEFTIHIEPDGRIILDGAGMHETSYRRILELLEETVGPVRHLDASEEPPSTHVHPVKRSAATSSQREDLEIRRRG
jgi:hypothetical protein